MNLSLQTLKVDTEVMWDLEGDLVPLKSPGLVSYGALEVGSLPNTQNLLGSRGNDS